MPIDYVHNDQTYQIDINGAQVGNLTNDAGNPVFMYYSSVRVKPAAGQQDDNTGWVLVKDGNQAAIEKTAEGARVRAEQYIQQQPP